MKHIYYFVKQIHAYSGKTLYINMFAMIAISLLEGVGILLLVPMISMSGIIDLGAVEIPIVKNLFHLLKDIPQSLVLPLILAIYVLIVVGQNVLNRHITVKSAIIQHGFLRHIRLKTYESLLHANWEFFIKKRKTDLINLLTAEIARASAGTHSFLQFITSLVFTIIQIGIAFLLSPVITMFVILCGAVLVLFNRKFLSRSLALGKRNYELGRNYLGGITDQINGIKDIKSNALENSRLEWYQSITEQMKKEQVEYTRLKSTSQLYYKIASAVLIAFFIFIALNLFNAQAGQLMLIVLIFSRLWPRVTGIQGSLEQIASMMPAFEAVKILQNESRNSREFNDTHQLEGKSIILERGITCKNVNFRYNKDINRYALKEINLFIPHNKMTAFVGKSGAGKSTLIDLLMGLNQPEKGEVFLDDKLLTKDNLKALRNSISYVPQEPFLFNESIRENLSLVAPDATEEEMWEALDFSSAGEFVCNLPERIDTVIGDRGVKLSGGERQRLVLARAILRKPSILVLDEATSALDTENEGNIQAALENLKGKMTIIVIAHRLSTIRHADQVIVMEEGEIVQQGGFFQLSEQQTGIFTKLLGKQLEVLH